MFIPAISPLLSEARKTTAAANSFDHVRANESTIPIVALESLDATVSNIHCDTNSDGCKRLIGKVEVGRGEWIYSHSARMSNILCQMAFKGSGAEGKVEIHASSSAKSCRHRANRNF
jgi:hypothetical protein